MSVTSDVTPRRNGFDLAALSASARTQASGDEVARLRAAVETLSELVLSHGIMDARTLKVLLGELLLPPLAPVALSSPLPPPATQAPQASQPAPRASQPAPRPASFAPPAAAPFAPPAAAPVAAAPVAVAQPAPAIVSSTPAPAIISSAPAPAPAPVAQPFRAAAGAAPARVPVAQPAPAPAAKPAPARPSIDAARLAEALADAPAPQLKKPGFFARLFGKGKASPAAVAANATEIEFTERVPKLPSDGLYSEHQRATELSFPPPSTLRKPRAAAPRKRTRPADAAPARFCDRCWRRLDAAGTCKTCSASA